MDKNNDCGSKHLKLVLGVIAVITVIVGGMCKVTISYARTAAQEMDARVRLLEQDQAASHERDKAIAQSLNRIEKMMETKWQQMH